MILIIVLIVLLAFLILLQATRSLMKAFKYIGFRFKEDVVEGLESNRTYTEVSLQQDPLYLAKVNAANITYLKEQVDKLSGLKQEVNQLNSQVESNASASSDIAIQLKNTSKELTAGAGDPDNLPSSNSLE
jgi:hypothetical protein